MSGLPGPRTAVVDEILRATAARMIEVFGIDEVEAVGRISSTLGSWDLDCDETDHVLGHEDADYWAHWIYYGPVDWWRLRPEQLMPKPWP
jgi:hypothetical protein